VVAVYKLKKMRKREKYEVTITHDSDGTTNICLTFRSVFANSFCMATAIVEEKAFSRSDIGNIISIEAKLIKN
jgi:hypothetical protein